MYVSLFEEAYALKYVLFQPTYLPLLPIKYAFPLVEFIPKVHSAFVVTVAVLMELSIFLMNIVRAFLMALRLCPKRTMGFTTP